MSRRLASRVHLPLLACLLMLLAQVAGAHLHLCLDGIDETMRAHAAADNDHADHHEEGRQDVDLAWLTGAPAKPSKAMPVLPVLSLVVVWVCVLSSSVRRVRPRVAGPPPFLSSILLQRPPLRGPPSFSR